MDFNEIAIKGIFLNGLNYFLRYFMPEMDSLGTLDEYSNYALLLSRSPFTVGVADVGFCNSPVLATPESRHVMAAESTKLQ